MKAMILAAGVGSRLGAVTQEIPKCLVKVAGKSMLQHTIERLKNVGVNEIVINLHHMPEKIIDHINQNDSFGIKIHFSHEDSLLDTGGGLKKASDVLRGNESFFLHNSDIYTTYDLKKLFTAHEKHQALASLLILDRQVSRGLYFDKSMQLVGWTAQQDLIVPEGAKHYGFSGIHVISPKLFECMPDKSVFSIIDVYVSAIKTNHLIYGYVPDEVGYWIDMGKPEALANLRKELEK